MAPNVAPVILLQGSDHNMGYQYARQLNQIFGPWALQRLKRKFTEAATLKAYHDELEKYTPEFIEMFRGVAAGATDAGVTLSYEEVLAYNLLSGNSTRENVSNLVKLDLV